MKTLTDQDLVPLTPNCLLIGRSSSSVTSVGVPDISVEDYPRRLRYCQELHQYWCREYDKQVFFNLLPYQKFKDTRRHENLRVGDVCLLSYPGKVQETSRYCRVDKVYPDEDMVVRNVRVSLRSRDAREKALLYKSKKPMQMDVGVRRLVLICPSEDVPVGDLSTPDSLLCRDGAEPSCSSQVIMVKVVLDAELIMDLK